MTDIVGIRRAQLFFDGRPDHAGTTPMHERSDALVAAAIVIRQAQRLALQWSRNTTHYVVATVGRLNVSPNASNTVPYQVDLTLEVRSNHAPCCRSSGKYWRGAAARLSSDWACTGGWSLAPMWTQSLARRRLRLRWSDQRDGWVWAVGACRAEPATMPCTLPARVTRG